MAVLSPCVLCWSAPAETAEHIFKKDIYSAITVDGKGDYFVGEKQHPIQGPNSKVLKPKKNLCAKCNNARSSGPDRSFSRLDEFLRLHKKEKGIFRQIDYGRIYLRNSEIHKCNVKRYFAKAMACYIDRANHQVPRVLGKIFLHYEYQMYLTVKISFDKSPVEEITEFLVNSPLTANFARTPEERAKGYTSEDLIRIGRIPYEYYFSVTHSEVEYFVKLIVPVKEAPVRA